MPGSFPERKKKQKQKQTKEKTIEKTLGSSQQLCWGEDWASRKATRMSTASAGLPSSQLPFPHKTAMDAGYFRENVLHSLISFSVIG